MIVVDPNVRNGRRFILGTSVTVADVAIAKLYHALNADAIADWYALTLPQVYSALAYYYEHKTEVDQPVCSQIRRAEALKEKRVAGCWFVPMATYRCSSRSIARSASSRQLPSVVALRHRR